MVVTMYWTELRRARDCVARYPLAAALGISLAIHLALFGGWRYGQAHGWWDYQATWLMNLTKKFHPAPKVAKNAPLRPSEAPLREIPLTFVEVDPALLAVEPPKEAKYYGALNSKEANPDPVLDSTAPKVDGSQTKIVRLENVPRPQPLQPAAPPKETKAPAAAKPKGAEPPGEMAKAEPLKATKPSDGQADASLGQAPATVREKPRKLAAVKPQATLVGEKMKQDGGANARGKITLNVKATPFGAYDAAFIAAVQQRWYDLIDTTQMAQRSGKVVLEFRLTYDGRITDMKVNGNEVGELLGILCQRAVLDPAPYAKWPSDMLRMVGTHHRDVTFTFYYN